MTRGEDHPNAKALTTDEVQEAIEAAGYAVEVELLAQMKAARFGSTIGLRQEAEPGTYQEIDLVGSLLRKVPRDDESGAAALFIAFTVLIQVKKPSGPSAFVGVLGGEESPADAEEDVSSRLALTGSVTLEDMDEDGVAELVVGHGREPQPGSEPQKTLAGCMQPFEGLPQCVHWAIARRKQDGKDWIPWATGEKGYFDDLEGLVKVREMRKVKERHRRLHESIYLPRIQQVNLCMVVDAPSLYLYEPLTKSIREVQALSLWKGFDTVQGARYAHIDIVTRAEFAGYLARCRRATKALHEFAKTRRDEILGVAEAVIRRSEVEQHDALPPAGGIFGP